MALVSVYGDGGRASLPVWRSKPIIGCLLSGT